MAPGFQPPGGDPEAIDGALAGIGGIGGDLRSQETTLRRGFAQARATWQAPRAADFDTAAAGIRAQVRTARSSVDGAVTILGDYARALRRARAEIAELGRQAASRRADVAGLAADDPRATAARPQATRGIDHLEDTADQIRGQLTSAAHRAAAAIDALTGAIVPGAATLSPEQIRRHVDAAYGVDATRTALAGAALTETGAWAALAAAQLTPPPDDWKDWAAQYDLADTDGFDAARGLELKAKLEALQGKAISMSPGEQATLVNQWAAALSRTDQVDLALTDPALVGNLDGIPNNVRYLANKINVWHGLQTEQARLAAWVPAPVELDPAQVGYERLKGRIATLTSLVDDKPLSGGDTGRSHQILAFVPPSYDGFAVSDDGRLAVVVGDLDTARHVGVSVPGITNRLDNFASTFKTAASIKRMSSDSAAIAWLGYDTPEFADSVTTDDAVTGGHTLADFMVGLQRAQGSDLTLMAHSYGTLVASQALQLTHARADLPDKVVLFGSPGLGDDIHSTADLGLPPHYPIYALRAPGDPVAILASFGADPVELPGITRLDTSWSGKEGVTGHSSYADKGSDSLTNLANVLDGGRLVTGGNPLDQDGLAGPYNENLRRFVDELQGQVPAEVVSRFASGLEADLELRMQTGDYFAGADDARHLVALFRQAEDESGIGDHLTHDEFEQAIVDAGFTDTLSTQAGDAVEHRIDGWDRLDGRTLRLPTLSAGVPPIGLPGGWPGLSYTIPDDANERLAGWAEGVSRSVTRHVSDLAVEHLPTLDGVLGAADAVARQVEDIEGTWRRVQETLDAVQDPVGTATDVARALIPGW